MNLIIGASRWSCFLLVFVASTLVAVAQPQRRDLPTPVKVLHTFSEATYALIGPYWTPTNADGAFCTATLVQGNDGKLYGVASSGGAFGGGTIFKLNLDGSDFTVLYTFGMAVRSPSGLIQGVDGHLYGAAFGGSAAGAIFRLNTDGSGLTNIHSFAVSDGQDLQGGVIQGPDGMLYGTAVAGGANGSGTVFKVGTDGNNFTVLYNFTSLNNGTNSDGIYPYSGLVLSGDTLYGTARYGGPSGSVRTDGMGRPGSGTLFTLKTNGTGFTVIHSFDRFSTDYRTNSDGACPATPLILGNDGKIYGTATEAGLGAAGTIFSADIDGNNYTVLHAFNSVRFPSEQYGMDPYGLSPYGLLLADDGKLYGAAYSDAVIYSGTIYRLNRDGSGIALLHHFGLPDPSTALNVDGTHSCAPLLKGKDGRFYGVARFGGANGSGTVFSFAQPVALEVGFSNEFVRVTWPISATNFVLETSDGISSNSVWTSSTNNIGIEGYDFSMTLPVTNSTAFFRLHQLQ